MSHAGRIGRHAAGRWSCAAAAGTRRGHRAPSASRAPRWVRALSALLSAALAAGCAAPTAPLPPDRLHAGRFAATVTFDGRSDATSGRFALAVRGARVALDISTPLGTTLARVELGPDGATLRASAADGTLRDARGASGEALLADLLGWPLPVDGIADWIAGRPMPQHPARVRLQDNQTIEIEQSGWSIRIEEHFADGTPRRLTLRRQAQPLPPAPAVILRLVLDEAPETAGATTAGD